MGLCFLFVTKAVLITQDVFIAADQSSHRVEVWSEEAGGEQGLGSGHSQDS